MRTVALTGATCADGDATGLEGTGEVADARAGVGAEAAGAGAAGPPQPARSAALVAASQSSRKARLGSQESIFTPHLQMEHYARAIRWLTLRRSERAARCSVDCTGRRRGRTCVSGDAAPDG